jgi:hypothetical protein
MKVIFAGLLVLFSYSTFSQPVSLNNFIIKEHLLKNGKLAVIAADSANKPVENINGTFVFSINGFKQELKFNDGVAVAPQQVEKSTFVYLKHENESSSPSKLYYVIKKEDSLNPIQINRMVMILIPLVIIGIITWFRRFIIFGIITLIVIFYFNSSRGLGISTLLETVVDGLKSFF